MIDYEITVDVSNVGVETKKQVQDAFFKLGLSWWDGDEYHCLDKGCYTNTFNTDRVTQDLMWADEGTEPTHTINELLELVDMKTKTDLKLFDLEKALMGEPVVLRNGQKAYVRHHETALWTEYPLSGYEVHGTDAFEATWTEGGDFFGDGDISTRDIVGMWVDPLVFNHWDLLSEDIKYLAKDCNGDWFGYSGKPSKEGGEWNDQRSYGFYSVGALNKTLFPDCDWENSLIKRN